MVPTSGPASLAACHSPQSEWGQQAAPKAFIPRPAEEERLARAAEEKSEQRKRFQEELDARSTRGASDLKEDGRLAEEVSSDLIPNLFPCSSKSFVCIFYRTHEAFKFVKLWL